MIDIVIPNWNGRHFLPVCLNAVRAQTFRERRVFLVDNGSADGSVDFVREHFPEVTPIPLAENTGFSPAVNRGIAAGDGEFVFLLNNDTELAPDCLERLMDAAAASPADFFAAKMVNYNQRDLLDGAGEGYLRGGAGYRLGTLEADGGFYATSRTVFGACAGAALYRRRVQDEVGGFDPDFFAYLEDVDWNLRAARLGKTCRYVAEARVFHIGSATSGSKFNPLTIRLSTRNSFFVLVKNYSAGMLLRFFLPIAIYQFFWLLFVLKKRQFTPYLQGCFAALADLPAMRRKYRAGLPGPEIEPALCGTNCGRPSARPWNPLCAGARRPGRATCFFTFTSNFSRDGDDAPNRGRHRLPQRGGRPAPLPGRAGGGQPAPGRDLHRGLRLGGRRLP